MRGMLIFFLAFFLLLSSSARADDKPRLADAMALQQAVEDAIAAAEPGVASILVSRSDEYKNWRAAPPVPENGKLGDFNTDAYWANLRNVERPEERRALLAIDLAHPDHHPEAYGSGTVIDSAGLVLTMAHVVRGATKIYVRLPGNQGSYADIHALDPRSDLAVLKLLNPPKNLKVIPLGDGSKVRKGQFVLLLANPYAAGFRDGSPSASLGMIANLRRRAPGLGGEMDRIEQRAKQTLHHYGTLLQVDTRLTLGSSGGALLNLKGELIGISTAQAALTGVESPGGFAVPLDAGMRRVVDCLIRGEEVDYGFLGVQARTDIPSGDGVVIELGSTNTPAARAGLATGDKIISINGHPVRNSDDLFLFIGTELAGGTARIEVQRAREKHTFTAQLAKYYYPVPGIAANRPPARFGLRVDYTSTLDQRLMVNRPLGRRGTAPGVVIREVIPNSSADRARLQPDKTITHVGSKPVTTPAQYYEAIKEAGAKVRLTVLNSDGEGEQIDLQDN